MSTTSKRYFEEKFKENIWNYFGSDIIKAKTARELSLIIDKYLPPQEKIMFEKRLGVLYLGEKGVGSREISKQIDITLKTISFIKKGFKPPIKRKAKSHPNTKGLKIPEWALKKNSKLKYKGVRV